MTVALESCPFCGNANVTARQASDDARSWLVACDAKSRDCPMEVRVIECFSEEQAIDAWNRRSSTPTRAATDAEIGEHHWRDGLRFKRLENGTVRIRRDANVIATIPAAEWESIVREVEPANRANGTALDGRLIASEVAGSSSPSSTTATPLSEEERKRTGLMEIEARTVAEARAWLANDFSVPVPRLDHLLRIIDRLTGAPK